MPLELSIIIIIAISFLFSKIARKIHLSEVIGLIVAGLLLSIPLLNNYIIANNEIYINKLSYLGLFTLMFLSGFEVSGNMLFKEKKDSLIITAFTVIFSLVLGILVFTMLGYSIETALIMGICFGITAEATKARVLIQLGKLKTKIGSLLMGSGIINDIFGVFALGIISYIFTKNFSYKEIEILGGIILFFFLGMGAHYLFDRFSLKIRIIEKFFLYTLVPFFFIEMGLNFNLNSLIIDYKILLIVIIVSTVGQLSGVMLTKPIIKLSIKQLYLVGWGMNSKGAVEIAIALVALQAGLIPNNLYSAIIITAIATTIMFQIIIFRLVKNNPNIMD